MALLTFELLNKRFTHEESRDGVARRLIFSAEISYGTLIIKDIGKLATGEVTFLERNRELPKTYDDLESKIIYSAGFVNDDTGISCPHFFRVLLILSSDTFNYLLSLDMLKNSINIHIDTVDLMRDGAIYYGDDPYGDEKIWDLNKGAMVLLSDMSIKVEDKEYLPSRVGS